MQRKRMWGLILVVLMVVASWSFYRTLRQSALNHELIVASHAGDSSEVLALLNRGADPNASEPRTPKTGWRHLLNLLLRNKQSFSLASPLSQAMTDESMNAIRGLTFIKVGGPGQAPFVAVSAPLLNDKQFEILRILLEHGANPNMKLPDGTSSPAHWWFEAKDKRVITLFLQHGANPNNIDPDGNSVLMYAVNVHNEDWIQAALKNGARPNQENVKGDTALMWAALDHDQEAVKRLLSSGADINHKNKNGHSALTYAVVNGEDLTWKHGVDQVLSTRERQETINSLLAAGAHR